MYDRGGKKPNMENFSCYSQLFRVLEQQQTENKWKFEQILNFSAYLTL